MGYYDRVYERSPEHILRRRGPRQVEKKPERPERIALRQRYAESGHRYQGAPLPSSPAEFDACDPISQVAVRVDEQLNF